MHCYTAPATNLNALRAKAAPRCCVPLGLAPDGVYQVLCHHRSSWSLTPRFHPCLCVQARHRRSISVALILQLALTGCYPASCPVEPGLSSRGALRAAGDCLSNFPTRSKYTVMQDGTQLQIVGNKFRQTAGGDRHRYSNRNGSVFTLEASTSTSSLAEARSRDNTSATPCFIIFSTLWPGSIRANPSANAS